MSSLCDIKVAVQNAVWGRRVQSSHGRSRRERYSVSIANISPLNFPCVTVQDVTTSVIQCSVILTIERKCSSTSRHKSSDALRELELIHINRANFLRGHFRLFIGLVSVHKVSNLKQFPPPNFRTTYLSPLCRCGVELQANKKQDT
jgi:hypothetical protein